MNDFYEVGRMAFPMLQVTSLAGESGLEEAEEGCSTTGGLPPVAGDTPTVPRAVYVIGEASKRSRSAGEPFHTCTLHHTK